MFSSTATTSNGCPWKITPLRVPTELLDFGRAHLHLHPGCAGHAAQVEVQVRQPVALERQRHRAGERLGVGPGGHRAQFRAGPGGAEREQGAAAQDPAPPGIVQPVAAQQHHLRQAEHGPVEARVAVPAVVGVERQLDRPAGLLAQVHGERHPAGLGDQDAVERLAVEHHADADAVHRMLFGLHAVGEPGPGGEDQPVVGAHRRKRDIPGGGGGLIVLGVQENRLHRARGGAAGVARLAGHGVIHRGPRQGVEPVPHGDELRRPGGDEQRGVAHGEQHGRAPGTPAWLAGRAAIPAALRANWRPCGTGGPPPVSGACHAGHGQQTARATRWVAQERARLLRRAHPPQPRVLAGGHRRPEP
ncbi:MAG: hypothetical protein HYU66_11385, partial [Armatimonadetes bacterium]|nr:hypothetical protein [Armatimonadota bacterium]